MSQVGNENRFGGEYMIQDRDHMSDINQPTENTNSDEVRQSDQSQQVGRQQGSGDNSSGGTQGKRQRQAQ